MRARSRIAASLAWATLPCVLAGALFAGETSPSLQTWLDTRAELWQQRLKLTNWKISVRVCGSAELRPNTLGNIHWDFEKKTAVIRVLNSAPADMERTIVHELVHLELAALPKSDESRRDEEQAVSSIADAILAMQAPH